MSFKEIPVEECGINPFADLSKYCIVTAGNKEKCNPMLVTWGSFGVMWRKPTATIYIRQSRFTKTILDSQDYYTLSVLPGFLQAEGKLHGIPFRTRRRQVRRKRPHPMLHR